jgi:hypothetical protein
MRVSGILVAIVLALGGNLLAYDNSPASVLIFPEVIWAQASGGGTWVSELQITNMTPNDALHVRFCYGGGSYRTTTLTNSPAQYSSLKFSNILATLQSIDTAFTYYGRVGCLIVDTYDSGHLIQGAVRTFNGNYSKNYQGLSGVPSNFIVLGRSMMIQNLTSNSTYRTSLSCFGWAGFQMTAEFALFDANGLMVGSPFFKTFVNSDFQSFNPFAEAGAPYPAQSNDNCWLRITPCDGDVYLFCFGSTANNYTNDPAAHIAMNYK